MTLIRLVVFNACFSQQQAESVVEHIEAAIGMSDSIPDETACVFAAQLYSSIGFGRSLKTSFDQAKAELLLEGISGENIPRVFTRDGIDANDMVFVSPKDLDTPEQFPSKYGILIDSIINDWRDFYDSRSGMGLCYRDD